MAETTLDDEDVGITPGVKPWWIAGALVILVLVIILMLSRHPRLKTGRGLKAETAQSAYALILGETRTGLRLARLEDFLTQYPRSELTRAARVQFRVLKTHENAAWARLTDMDYNLEADGVQKTKARVHYLNNWGPLNRPGYFNARASRDNNQTLIFETPKSRFTKDTDSQTMAGSAAGRMPRPQEQRRAPIIVKARVKTSRRPVYPRKAYRRGIEGAVTLALDIDVNGRVINTRVMAFQGSRYKNDFIKSARRAASRSRFYPKTVNGRPVLTHGYLRQYTFDIGG